MCDWPGCRDDATHSVSITFPDLPTEQWHVCREHDRQLKLSAVRSRPRKPPGVEEAVPNVVRCGRCKRVIDEPSTLAPELRSRCPDCGSTTRLIEAYLFGRLEVHDSLDVRKKTPGKGGWVFATSGGDDYTRDLDAWGTRGLTRDREHDVYREDIVLWDGTRIVSTARLSDHKG